MNVSADLHIHSALSPCAEREMDPPRIFNHVIELGLKAIAITDHNSTANLPAFMEDPPDELWVIPGMELQTKEEVHLVCYFPTLTEAMACGLKVNEYLPNLPLGLAKTYGEQTKINRQGDTIGEETKPLLASTDLGLNEAFALISLYNGLAYPAHADRLSFGIMGQLGFIPPNLPVHTLEVSHHLDKEASLVLFPEFQTFQSSDAHRLAEIGRGCSMLMIDHPCWEEFVAAMERQNGRWIEV